LKDKIDEFEPQGGTILGPALLASVSIAAKGKV